MTLKSMPSNDGFRMEGSNIYSEKDLKISLKKVIDNIQELFRKGYINRSIELKMIKILKEEFEGLI